MNLDETIKAYDYRNIWRRPPAWCKGNIGSNDAGFLGAMIEFLKPGRILEIGTASGYSAAMMIEAWQRIPKEDLPKSDGGPVIDTFDLRERCFWSPEHVIGAAFEEMVPHLQHLVHFHRGKTAKDVASCCAAQSFDFAFIDANHRHPHPALDLFFILPMLKPETWVALHDINLTKLAPPKDAESKGPMNVFENYPYRKIEAQNIGAVQLPRDRSLIVDYLYEIMSLETDDGTDMAAMETVKAVLGRR